MADLTYIRVEQDAEIAVICIDRQDKLNALNAEVVAELGQVFESLREDDSVRGVIVTGALDTATPDALVFESSLFGLLASTDDMKEGMAAFMEKRKADFKGR